MIIVDSQGGVFSSGYNYNGQLGRACGERMSSKLMPIENIPPMVEVTCGYLHSLSMDENGGVWTWGGGGDGQLGTGESCNETEPTQVPSLNGISALVAGGNHSMAFLQGGGLLVFGSNLDGQLGLPLNYSASQNSPVVSTVQAALPYSTRSRQKSARSILNALVMEAHVP